MATLQEILKNIWHGVDVGAHVVADAAPIISLINPAAGAIAGLISGAIIKAETAFPATGSGPQKLQYVKDDILPSVELAFAIAGKPIDPKIHDFITDYVNAQVARDNALKQITGLVQAK
jgi:hypothetical protein